MKKKVISAALATSIVLGSASGVVQAALNEEEWVVKDETFTPIPYETIEEEDSTLLKGERVVKQEGVEGEKRDFVEENKLVFPEDSDHEVETRFVEETGQVFEKTGTFFNGTNKSNTMAFIIEDENGDYIYDKDYDLYDSHGKLVFTLRQSEDYGMNNLRINKSGFEHGATTDGYKLGIREFKHSHHLFEGEPRYLSELDYAMFRESLVNKLYIFREYGSGGDFIKINENNLNKDNAELYKYVLFAQFNAEYVNIINNLLRLEHEGFIDDIFERDDSGLFESNPIKLPIEQELDLEFLGKDGNLDFSFLKVEYDMNKGEYYIDTGGNPLYPRWFLGEEYFAFISNNKNQDLKDYVDSLGEDLDFFPLKKDSGFDPYKGKYYKKDLLPLKSALAKSQVSSLIGMSLDEKSVPIVLPFGDYYLVEKGEAPTSSSIKISSDSRGINVVGGSDSNFGAEIREGYAYRMDPGFIYNELGIDNVPSAIQLALGELGIEEEFGVQYSYTNLTILDFIRPYDPIGIEMFGDISGKELPPITAEGRKWIVDKIEEGLKKIGLPVVDNLYEYLADWEPPLSMKAAVEYDDTVQSLKKNAEYYMDEYDFEGALLGYHLPLYYQTLAPDKTIYNENIYMPDGSENSDVEHAFGTYYQHNMNINDSSNKMSSFVNSDLKKLDDLSKKNPLLFIANTIIPNVGKVVENNPFMNPTHPEYGDFNYLYIRPTNFTPEEKSGSEIVKEPIDEIVLVGTREPEWVEVKSEDVDVQFEIVTQDDPGAVAGTEVVVQEGKPGITKEITYKLEGTDEVRVEKIVIQEPVPKIVKVGTKDAEWIIESEKEVEVAYQTETKDNPELEKGQRKVIQEGKPGVSKEITYKLEGADKTKTETVVVTEPVTEIVEVGTKVVSKPDANKDDKNNKPGEDKKEPSKEKWLVEEEKDITVKYKTETREDFSLEKGKREVIRSGVDGITREITYKLEGSDRTKKETKVIREPVNEIVRVGARVKGEAPATRGKGKEEKPKTNDAATLTGLGATVVLGAAGAFALANKKKED